MKNNKAKKILALVAGSLVIALVLSILPGGFLASAAELSKREARNIAMEELDHNGLINADDIEDIEAKLDRDGKYYTVYVKGSEIGYELKIDANNGEVQDELTKVSREGKTELSLAKVAKESKEEKEVKEQVFEDFEDFLGEAELGKAKDLMDKEAIIEAVKDSDYLKDDEYTEDYDKNTKEAALNQLLKDGKKAAISDFKAAKDANDEDAKEEFKAAKDILKEVKKEEKTSIKEEKQTSKNDDDDDDDDDDKNLIEKAKITKEEALTIALKKVGLDTNSKGLDDKSVEFDDDNPPVYEVKFTYTIDKVETEYEIRVHAISGTVLDVEKEVEEVKRVKEVKEVKENNNNSNKNNEKSNNGKGKK